MPKPLILVCGGDLEICCISNQTFYWYPLSHNCNSNVNVYVHSLSAWFPLTASPFMLCPCPCQCSCNMNMNMNANMNVNMKMNVDIFLEFFLSVIGFLSCWICLISEYTKMSILWKEATAAMTALVYSGLHTRLYRGYVQVYWLVYRTRMYASTVHAEASRLGFHNIMYDSVWDLDLYSEKMFSDIYWYTRIRISPKYFSVT